MSRYPILSGATWDDLIAAPHTVVAEWVDHVLYAFPRPGRERTRAFTKLTSFLERHFDAADGWWIVPEPLLQDGDPTEYPEVALVPEVAGWRRKRMPEYPDTSGERTWPDWICEIVYPSTGEFDRTQKMPEYGSRGVEFVWIVDPAERTLEVYRRAAEGWLMRVFGGDDTVRAEPFEAVELPLGALWLPPATAPDPRS